MRNLESAFPRLSKHKTSFDTKKDGLVLRRKKYDIVNIIDIDNEISRNILNN